MSLWMPARILLGAWIFVASFRTPRSKFWDGLLYLGIGLLTVLQAKMLIGTPLQEGCDLDLFRQSGLAIWQGGDPYVPPVLSSPNAMFLFALFALLPLSVMAWIWKWFNLAGATLLVPISNQIISKPGGQPARSALTSAQVAGVAALVLLSDTSIRNAGQGQVHVWAALFILLALLSLERGFQIAAGLCLALAAVKVHTVLPFLFLFHPKADRRCLFAFFGAGVALTFVAVPPWVLPQRISGALANIKALSIPGGGNDYSYQGPACSSILGFNHVLYRIGFRDRAWIGVIHHLLSFALLIWAGWRIRSGRLPRPAQYALAALVAMTFLYHRLYDAILLAFPLTYAAARFAVDSSARARRFHGLMGAAIAAMLCIPEYGLTVLTKAQPPWPVQAVVLTAPFWLILVATAALDAAERAETAPAEQPKIVPSTGLIAP